MEFRTLWSIFLLSLCSARIFKVLGKNEKKRQARHKNLKIKSGIRWKPLPRRGYKIMGLKGEKRDAQKWNFTSNHIASSRQERLKDLTWQETRTSDRQGRQHKQKKDLSGPRKKAQVCVWAQQSRVEKQSREPDKRFNLPTEEQKSTSMAKG